MPKYADPAVFPVTSPAATDNVMTRTAAGTDGNFALGNLAGLAPLAIANDQAPFVSGGAWGAYTLTSVGRTLLAATTQAAQRTAIQAVGLVGAEAIAGIKTCSDAWQWNLSTAGLIRYANPGNQIGIIFRFGDPAMGDASMYRSEIRFGQGLMNVFVNDVAGTATGTHGYFVNTTTLSPQVTNAMSCGSSVRLWTQVWATNAAIQTSDARLKTDPRQLRDAEFKAASAIARLPAVWRWLSRVHGDENCEPEGREARKHFGPTVQAAIAVMEAHGLDPFAYSFICYDEWEALPEQWHEWPAQEAVLDDDGNEIEPAVEAGRELVQEAREAGDRYSFRKEELLCFIVRALAQEIDGLSARVAALEAGRNP